MKLFVVIVGLVRAWMEVVVGKYARQSQVVLVACRERTSRLQVDDNDDHTAFQVRSSW